MKKITALLFIAVLAVLVSSLFGVSPVVTIAGLTTIAAFAQAPKNAAFMNLSLIDGLTRDTYSNYDGDQTSDYTGFGDDLVDFGGKAVDFGSEIAAATERVFTITITNISGAAKTIYLNGSYDLDSSLLIVKDGEMLSASGTEVVSGSGSPKTISNFLNWIKNNPTQIIAFKVSSSNEAQLAQVINIKRQSPFKDLETEQINLASFTTEMANNTKMVTVRRSFQLDNQTDVYFVIPAGTSSVPTITTITLYCGAVLNTAKALHNKKARASANPQVAQTQAVLLGK